MDFAKIKNANRTDVREYNYISASNFFHIFVPSVGTCILFSDKEVIIDDFSTGVDFFIIQSDFGIEEKNKTLRIKYDEETDLFFVPSELKGKENRAFNCFYVFEKKYDFKYWEDEIFSMPSNNFNFFIDVLKKNKKDISFLSEEKAEKKNVSPKNKKEKISMNFDKMFSGFDFDFGKVQDGSAVYSIYGIAIKSVDKDGNEKFICYDGEEATDVSGFVISSVPVMKVPVNYKDICCKDIIVHNGNYMFVKNKKENNSLEVFDIGNMEMKTICLAKSPFGVYLCTKIVSAISVIYNGNPSAGNTNPFENIFGSGMQNPFAMKMMMDIFKEKDSEESSEDKFFEMMLMANMLHPGDTNK